MIAILVIAIQSIDMLIMLQIAQQGSLSHSAMIFSVNTVCFNMSQSYDTYVRSDSAKK